MAQKILIREKWAERIGLLVFLLGCHDLMRLLPFGLQKQIHQAGAGFKSLTEAIDTTTPTGCMMMQMVGTFAEFEREMIRERTQAGLKVAKDEGRTGGRKPTLREDQRTDIIENILDGRKTGPQMARRYNVSEATISRVMAAHRQVLARD